MADAVLDARGVFAPNVHVEVGDVVAAFIPAESSFTGDDFFYAGVVSETCWSPHDTYVEVEPIDGDWHHALMFVPDRVVALDLLTLPG